MITKNTSYFTRVVPKGLWFPILFIRLCLGFFFAFTGLTALLLPEKRDLLNQIFVTGNLPMPQMFVYLIPSLELVFGLLLIFGLFTTISSMILFLINGLFVFLIKVPSIKTEAFLPWFLDFIYLPEMLFFLLFFFLIFSGGGKASLDYAITYRKLKKENSPQSFDDHHHHHQL